MASSIRLQVSPFSKEIRDTVKTVKLKGQPNGFYLFCHCLKNQLEGTQPALAMKIIMDEWKKLSKEKQRKYREMARNLNSSESETQEVIDLDNESENIVSIEIEDYAYMIFSEEMEKLARKSHDFIVVDDLLEQIRTKWEGMSYTDKSYYYDIAKCRYEEGYIGPQNPLKKPIPPFFAFSNKIRAELRKTNPNYTYDEIKQIVSAAWKRISDEEKQRLQDQYNFERERYGIMVSHQRIPEDDNSPKRGKKKRLVLPSLSTINKAVNLVKKDVPADCDRYLYILKNLATLCNKLGLSNNTNKIEDIFHKLIDH